MLIDILTKIKSKFKNLCGFIAGFKVAVVAHFIKVPNRKIFGLPTARMLSRYCMDTVWMVHKTHFRKKHLKIEYYSKFFDLVRKNRKLKKMKNGALRSKNS
ncbi:MAG: hypothetical protein RSF68_02490 [Myroides sp.]